MDNELEHHAIRADLKQYVNNGIYHVQHVNSLHNRLKKWIDDQFWGVSTKHLQQYLNWFRMKEALKHTAHPTHEFARRTVLDVGSYKRYTEIDKKFELLKKSLN